MLINGLKIMLLWEIRGTNSKRVSGFPKGNTEINSRRLIIPLMSQSLKPKILNSSSINLLKYGNKKPFSAH